MNQEIEELGPVEAIEYLDEIRREYEEQGCFKGREKANWNLLFMIFEGRALADKKEKLKLIEYERRCKKSMNERAAS